MAEVFGIVSAVLGLLPLCRGELSKLLLSRGHTTHRLDDIN